MPVYAYHCRSCDSDFDFKQSFSEDPLTVCQVCGAEGQVFRVIQPAGVVFKGSGFYVTDNRSASKPSPVNGKKDESTSTNGSSSAKSETSDSKTTSSVSSGAAD
ncbi:MAG: FmdB family transcriptional regulator [Phototrophicales bacterium]|nr:MAG: FmdB family transcriptional regulator [Phototrophicales bacterium]